MKQQQTFDIVLIGSGKVATHLGRALVQAGLPVAQVYSPTKAHARRLARELNAQAVTDPKQVFDFAELYIIAVKDDAVADVVKKLPDVNGLVVHTSGSVPLAAISSRFANAGVFYPLQTFSAKRKPDFKTIPVCLEATNKPALAQLKQVAKKLSSTVRVIDSAQRAQLHLAAVFANNFTNHFYALAQELLQQQKLDFSLLHPLIRETAEKATVLSPAAAQTGPALRNDKKAMQAHLALLKKNPKLAALYKTVSSGIQEHRKKHGT